MNNQEIEKQIKIIEASIQLYDDNIKELDTITRFNVDKNGNRRYTDEYIDDRIHLINQARTPLIGELNEYKSCIGDNVTPVTATPVTKGNTTNNKGKKTTKKSKPITEVIEEIDSREVTPVYTPSLDSLTMGSFDIIPLPSKGECYQNKVDKVAVSYLNAYDENIITSINLYNDNSFIDYLLKEKIQDKNIIPENLLKGDRDAILLWLRTTGYGVEYPVRVTDPITGEDFETVVDLSTIKTKSFTLKGDKDGLFDFILPISRDKVKFKFLTSIEDKKLDLIDKFNDNDIKKNTLEKSCEQIKDILLVEKDIDPNRRKQVDSLIDVIKLWSEGIESDNPSLISQKMTNRMEMNIMSINGNSDREYIHEYIKQMKAKDSLELRKYIRDNEPGMDYNVTIERPAILGGGSFTTFLSLDQFLFLYLT